LDTTIWNEDHVSEQPVEVLVFYTFTDLGGGKNNLA
jgi:hypothetical protein